MGESLLASKNLQIGTFTLTGIPFAPRGEPQVRVTFAVDRYCRVSVSASIANTDLHVEGTASDILQYLTPARLQAIRQAAADDRESEAEIVRDIEARNAAESLIARAEAALRTAQEETIDFWAEAEISRALAELGLALESSDVGAITEATNALSAALDAREGFNFNDFFSESFAVSPDQSVALADQQSASFAIPEEDAQEASPLAAVPGRVFIVHGHDDAAKESVARFLERLGLTVVILHEQPNGGLTIIEKLEHHASVDFAIVLLTPDDIGASAAFPAQLRARARQNVVLEMGLFIGKLGRHRVCALHRGDLELPSDYYGVVYIPMDAHGGWRLPLLRELATAGFPIEVGRAL
jgi:predicted nucleotide-binding protein